MWPAVVFSVQAWQGRDEGGQGLVLGVRQRKKFFYAVAFGTKTEKQFRKASSMYAKTRHGAVLNKSETLKIENSPLIILNIILLLTNFLFLRHYSVSRRSKLCRLAQVRRRLQWLLTCTVEIISQP